MTPLFLSFILSSVAIPPFSHSFLSHSHLMFVRHRTRRWEEAEVGGDQSGFDKVGLMLICLTVQLPLYSLLYGIYMDICFLFQNCN